MKLSSVKTSCRAQTISRRSVPSPKLHSLFKLFLDLKTEFVQTFRWRSTRRYKIFLDADEEVVRQSNKLFQTFQTFKSNFIWNLVDQQSFRGTKKFEFVKDSSAKVFVRAESSQNFLEKACVWREANFSRRSSLDISWEKMEVCEKVFVGEVSTKRNIYSYNSVSFTSGKFEKFGTFSNLCEVESTSNFLWPSF